MSDWKSRFSGLANNGEIRKAFEFSCKCDYYNLMIKVASNETLLGTFPSSILKTISSLFLFVAVFVHL
jgi:hypothetical protein